MYKLQCIDRMFALLDILADSVGPLTLHQVTQISGMCKATVHRFLFVMERHALVKRDKNGGWRVTFDPRDMKRKVR